MKRWDKASSEWPWVVGEKGVIASSAYSIVEDYGAVKLWDNGSTGWPSTYHGATKNWGKGGPRSLVKVL